MMSEHGEGGFNLEKELRLFDFIEHLNEAIWCMEPDAPIDTRLPYDEQLDLLNHAVCVQCNAAGARLLQCDRSNCPKRRMSDIVERNQMQVQVLIDMIQKGPRIVDVETRLQFDGEERWFLTSLYADIQGNHLQRIWGKQRDITRERIIGKAAEASERYLQHLSEAMMDMMAEVDDRGRFTYVSPSSEVMLGYAPSDVRGRSFWAFIHPADVDHVQSHLMKAMQTESDPGPVRVVHRINKDDGRVMWVETVGCRISSQPDEVGWVLTIRDISERMRADMLQGALYRISETAYNAEDLFDLYRQVHQVIGELLPAKNIFIALFTQNGKGILYPYYIDECDQTMPDPARVYTVDEMQGSYTLYVLSSGKPILISQDNVEELAALGITGVGQRSVDWLGTPLTTPDGRVIGLIAVQTYNEGERYTEADKDMLVFVSTQIANAIERRRVQETLLESEQRLNLALQAAEMGLWEYSYTTNKIRLNQKACAILGMEHSFVRLDELLVNIHPEDMERISEIINDGRVNATIPYFHLEFRLKSQADQYTWVELVGNQQELSQSADAPRLIGTIKDIGPRKRAEQILTQRDAVLEAVGFAAESFLRSTSWETSLHSVLQRLGASTAADRVYIFRRHTDEKNRLVFSQCYEWVADGITPQLHNPETKNIHVDSPTFARWYAHLINNDVIQGRVADFPAIERDVLERQQICSVIAVPIFADQQWWGFLGFDSCSEAKDLSDFEVEVLRVAADILGASIQNQKTESSLRESEERQRAIINAMPDLILLMDREGRYVDVYAKDVNLLAAPPEQLIGRTVNEMVPAEVARIWDSACIQARATGNVVQCEYTLNLGGTEHYFDARITCYREDETLAIVRDITERKQSEETIMRANEQLKTWVSELEQRNHETILLNRMGDMLQSCLSLTEAYMVIRQYCQQLFKDISGVLYIFEEGKDILETVTNWGEGSKGMPLVSPDMCWGLRRGRIHKVNHEFGGLKCHHLWNPDELVEDISYLCIPMIAQGETLGLLHLRADQAGVIDRCENLATTVGEQLALALSNLRLRQLLQSQSVRDGLTNLYNRRYMQETLEREMSRARRYQSSLVVVMTDIDRFKTYNDTYGHEVGDVALQEISLLLMSTIRKEDVACRYGGDELAIILPGATIPDAMQRIEQFRQAIRRLHMGGVDEFGPITLSYGVACYPNDGSTQKELLKAADLALYQAKQQGRDRAVAYLPEFGRVNQ